MTASPLSENLTKIRVEWGDISDIWIFRGTPALSCAPEEIIRDGDCSLSRRIHALIPTRSRGSVGVVV